MAADRPNGFEVGGSSRVLCGQIIADQLISSTQLEAMMDMMKMELQEVSVI